MGDTGMSISKNTLISNILRKQDFFSRQFSIRRAFTGGEIHFNWWGIQKGWWGFSPPVDYLKNALGWTALLGFYTKFNS